MGSINPKATPPTVLNQAATGVLVPKVSYPRLGSSSRKARAIRMPPPMTKGSI
jgi:hypothetical protein